MHRLIFFDQHAIHAATEKSEHNYPKNISNSKQDKQTNKHRCSIIDLRQVPTFPLNHTILLFWTKVVQNQNLFTEKEILNIAIEFSIFQSV